MPEKILSAALYVVATPIGNLGDITLRALDVLRGVELVAAEDTRVAGRLLTHFGISKPLLAVHQHNERRACAAVLQVLRAGRSAALVSDAGTPGLSDPGAVLVEAVRAAGFAAQPIPGPSALAAAWSVSGFAGSQFLFHGFLPARAAERRRVLASLQNIACPLIFFEAPHRVKATLTDLCSVLGPERTIVIARELTKVFETVFATTLGGVAAWMNEDANRQRGEFVLMVSGASGDAAPQADAGKAILSVLLKELSPTQAARLAAHLSGVARNTLYDMAVAMRERQ